MTATAEPTAATTAAPTAQTTVDGGIVRLNATDGLFLRAEHLTKMQDYSRELARCAGLAAGNGVVHGYGAYLSADGQTLRVGPGLALDATGRPLRSSTDVTLALGGLTGQNDPPDRFWVVEVLGADPTESGNEPVFGNLCDDPCSPATIHPWLTEGTVVRVRPDTMTGLGDVAAPSYRRNRLASAYMEREREQGRPWLTPLQADGGVAPIAANPWSAPTPAPTGPAVPASVGPTVPIAVLVRVDDRWVLDVWTARRDLDGAPSRPAWQWRLGMRPWPAFLAQVLQFQDQLAQAWPPGAGPAVPPPPATIRNAQQALLDFGRLGKRAGKLNNELAEALTALLPAPAVPVTTLPGLGFRELPPAGFLPAVPQNDQTVLQSYYAGLFGDAVQVRICHCRADCVPLALEEAQHLDRIPLDAPVGDAHDAPAVDVLVPDRLPDLAAVRPARYGWVAFVRRSPVSCERDTDDVGFYLRPTAGPVDLDKYDGPVAGDVSLGTLAYPAGGWAYPEGDDAVVDALVHNPAWDTRPGRTVTLVAVAATDERRPLAALRATLFAGSIGEPIGTPDVVARTIAGAEESVLVVVTPPPDNG